VCIKICSQAKNVYSTGCAAAQIVLLRIEQDWVNVKDSGVKKDDEQEMKGQI
jgi:hypothetical protein